MNTYVFNMRGPVGTVAFYEDDLKSIIWEKDEDGCWVSYDSIPCVSEPIDTEVYVYDFRVCGNDLFVGGARVKSIYSTNGMWKLIEDWKKLLDVPEDMEESRRPHGRMLSELFNKHYPDDDEIIFVVGPYVYDYKGTWGGLDGYDSCDAFTDYESAERFAQHNLANTSEEGVYFPIFKVEREEWERSQCGCLTDDMVVGIVKKDEMLMRNMKYGRDLDFRYMPKTITGRGEYNQRMAYWGHIDESNHPRGRMLKEANRNHTGFIPYTMRQYYNEYDKKWHPCVVYINSRDNGEWWIEMFDDEGTNEIGWDYEKFTINGTSKCDPEEVKWIEDTFISDCKEYGGVPLRRVYSLLNFGSGNNYIGKM